MVRAAVRSSHQRPGGPSGADGRDDAGRRAAKPDCAVSNRQHDSRGAKKSPRRDQIPEATGNDQEFRERGASTRVHASGSSPQGVTERDSGLGVATRQGCIHRMAADERRVPVGALKFQLESTVF